MKRKYVMENRVFKGVYLSETMAKRLDRYAGLTGRSFSGLVRVILAQWLKKEDSKE